MKNISEHKKSRTATLIFGVLVVFFLYSSAFPDSNRNIRYSAQMEQSGDKDEPEQDYLLISGDWVAVTVSLQMQPILKWIRDIDFLENPVIHSHEIMGTGLTQFFQTLFQRIISPNAP